MAIAVLAGAVPSTAAEPRLVVGEPQGLPQADEDRPVRVSVKAVGSNVSRVQVVLRDSDGKVVGRSRRFGLAEGERKVARVKVRDDLPVGRYIARATGHTR